MLPVVLLLAVWFALNLGLVVVSMLRAEPRSRTATSPMRARHPDAADPRTAPMWTSTSAM